MRTCSRKLTMALLIFSSLHSAVRGEEYRQLPVREYADKMRAGWIGQMAGVGLGGPTEFKWKGSIIPEDRIPEWKPAMINQFRQDDIYVEMTFIHSIEKHGTNLDIRRAGIDFANSGYRLWHANRDGRDNLRNGIAPPASGHPRFNRHADDIDYQIEADYSGLIAPGLPNRVIELGELFGRLMNYGDGLYGGQFVGAMYAEAFFESDMIRIVQAGLSAIPAGSQYHECISDVLSWYSQNPENWQKTWQLIEEKYNKTPEYRKFSCSKKGLNIDAKINGAYIVMGLLYGDRDPEKTIKISTRCGQDSDCNPSNAAGILFTTIGFSDLPKRFVSALDPNREFSHTPYTFPTLCKTCELLARKTVVGSGGRIEKSENGEEVFVIPRRNAEPSGLEQSWDPGPCEETRFTEKEMAQINPPPEPEKRKNKRKDIARAVEKFAPGWQISDCGADMNPGLRDEWQGRKNVLVTHPLSKSVPCVLTRKVNIPPDTATVLNLGVGHYSKGDWTLTVKTDGATLLKKKISEGTCTDGWAEITVDLSSHAGESIKLELENRADGWSWEAGYWSHIAITNK